LKFNSKIQNLIDAMLYPQYVLISYYYYIILDIFSGYFVFYQGADGDKRVSTYFSNIVLVQNVGICSSNLTKSSYLVAVYIIMFFFKRLLIL